MQGFCARFLFFFFVIVLLKAQHASLCSVLVETRNKFILPFTSEHLYSFSQQRVEFQTPQETANKTQQTKHSKQTKKNDVIITTALIAKKDPKTGK